MFNNIPMADIRLYDIIILFVIIIIDLVTKKKNWIPIFIMGQKENLLTSPGYNLYYVVPIYN